MSTNLPIILDWSQLRGMDPLPARIVWERDGKEMALVPPGKFTMGITEHEARRLVEEWDYPESFALAWTPRRDVTLGAYYIDLTPVTHNEYARFLAANPQHQTPYVEELWAQPYNWDTETRQPPDELLQHPVVLVNWQDATAYTDWAGKTLPTEAQWEKAARGTDGRVFPWGNQWEELHLNSAESRMDSPLTSYPLWREWWEKLDKATAAGTTPVGTHPSGASPYGMLDMAGNVFEYTSSPYLAYTGSQIEHPAFNETLRVARGGSWDFIALGAHSFTRLAFETTIRLNFVGFRCVSAPF